MNTGIKILVGIVTGAVIAFFYFNRKKGALVAAPPNTPIPAPANGSSNEIKQPGIVAGSNNGTIRNNPKPGIIKPTGVIINGFIDGVNPNLVITDSQAYINSAIANGNVKPGNPTTVNQYTDGDVVEVTPGNFVIVRY